MASDDIRNSLLSAISRQRSSPMAKLARMPGKLLRARLARILPQTTATADLICRRTMQVVLPEPVSTALYSYGYFDAPVCQMMFDHVQPGAIVFDIGAHFGFFSVLASVLVGSTGQVHSFEPTPSTFRMLEQNTKDIPQVRRNNCAVSDQNGETEFSDFGLKFSAWNTISNARLADIPAAARITIKTVTIDSYCDTNQVRPSFIKIDAENAEPLILRGMTQLLRSRGPLAIAMEAGNEASRETAVMLQAMGFRVFSYDDNGARKSLDGNESEITRIKDVLFVK